MTTPTKFWKVTLKGKRSADQIQLAVGQLGGLLLRVHLEGRETRVYFAAPKPAPAALSKAFRRTRTAREVPLDEVTRID